MRSVTDRNFGLLVAYLLPGFIAVNGLALHSPRLASWFGATSCNISPSVGGFLFLTVASLFTGMLLSTVRWLAVDRLLHLTGVNEPAWDFKKLSERLAAFEALIEIHYRYYQFHANSLIAVPSYCLLRWSKVGWSYSEAVVLFFTCLVLYLGARDTLAKYYRRADHLLDNSISIT